MKLSYLLLLLIGMSSSLLSQVNYLHLLNKGEKRVTNLLGKPAQRNKLGYGFQLCYLTKDDEGRDLSVTLLIQKKKFTAIRLTTIRKEPEEAMTLWENFRSSFQKSRFTITNIDASVPTCSMINRESEVSLTLSSNYVEDWDSYTIDMIAQTKDA